jgi:hypothetical protein
MGIGLKEFLKSEFEKIPASISCNEVADIFFKSICNDDFIKLYNIYLARILYRTIKTIIQTNLTHQKAFEKVCKGEFEYENTILRRGVETYKTEIKDEIKKKVAKVLKEKFYIDVNPLYEFVNEKFIEDDSDPIHDMNIGDPRYFHVELMKKFAEDNGFEFGFNKNKTPYISVPVDYFDFLSYYPRTWPVLVKKIHYTVTYVEDWENKYSLRKIWYGYESSPYGFYKYYDKEKMLNAFQRQLKTQKFPLKNLKQNLMGRYSNGHDIIERIKLNVKKELRKK